MRPAIVVLLSLLLLQTASGVQATSTSSGTAQTPVKHVIMIMLENHSFDNVFGLYPTMNRTNPGPLLSSLQAPDDVLGVPPSTARTLSQVPNGTYWTVNPNEGVYAADWANGKMDGFSSNSGTQAMSYFSSAQFAVEWDWAVEYATADRYFASCLCMTNPNRLYSLAGYGAGLTGDSGPPPYVPVNQSIFAELNHYGVSWGYYIRGSSSDNFPLNYFDGMGAYSSQIQPWTSFYGALQQGTLPAVSWVMPVGGGSTTGEFDQHPEGNVTTGEGWLLGVVDRVMLSPYWNSTAIFIAYDEGGGYYDHVPPPMVGGVQLGFRVPLLVISPYTKENYVSHTVMNHASQLAFIDYNWGLPALNGFVSDSGIPLDMFNFGAAAARSPVILANSSRFPVSPQVPFGQLPYQRTGSYNMTLSSLGVQDYVASNNSVTPFYQSTPFAVAVGASLIVLLILASRLARRKRKSSQSPDRGASVV